MKNIKVRTRNTEARKKEYVGKTIRGCTVIDVVRTHKSYSMVLECNECGEIFNRKMSKFLRGDIQACHRNHVDKEREERLKKPREKQNPNHGKKIYKDLSGQKIGRFTVLEHVGFHTQRGGGVTPTYLCQCECGEKCVLTRDAIKTRKFCDKELLELKQQQGRRSAKIRADKAKAKGKYKGKTFRGKNGRLISKFSKEVYEKFYGVCQKCNGKFKKEDTAAHHIIPMATKESLAFFPSNGILMCKDCHDKFHHKYGAVNFDYTKIYDYINNTETDNPQKEIVWDF